MGPKWPRRRLNDPANHNTRSTEPDAHLSVHTVFINEISLQLHELRWQCVERADHSDGLLHVLEQPNNSWPNHACVAVT